MQKIEIPTFDLTQAELVDWYSNLGVNPELAKYLSKSFDTSYQPNILRGIPGSRLFKIASFKFFVKELSALQNFLNYIAGNIKKAHIHIPEPREGRDEALFFASSFVPNREFLVQCLESSKPFDLYVIARMTEDEARSWLEERGLQEFGSSLNVLQVGLHALLEHNKNYQ